jgi:hypothetical protein
MSIGMTTKAKQKKVTIAKNIFSILRLNKALICFSPMNKMEIKNNKIRSFLNEPQGVSFIASPKQPQSVTLL